MKPSFWACRYFQCSWCFSELPLFWYTFPSIFIYLFIFLQYLIVTLHLFESTFVPLPLPVPPVPCAGSPMERPRSTAVTSHNSRRANSQPRAPSFFPWARPRAHAGRRGRSPGCGRACARRLDPRASTLIWGNTWRPRTERGFLRVTLGDWQHKHSGAPPVVKC